MELKIYNENDYFITYIVEFSGVKYIFWIPKSKITSKVVNVYFDNNIKTYETTIIGLSLNGIDNMNDLKTAIEIFEGVMREYNFGNITYNFIPHNDTQKELARTLNQMFNPSTEDTFLADTNLNQSTSSDSNVIPFSKSQQPYAKIRATTTHTAPVITNNSGPIGQSQPRIGRAAFVNLPVLIFVLSSLVLIISLILLYILD